MGKLNALYRYLSNAMLSHEARVLLYLAEAGRAESIMEISRGTGLPYSTCHDVVTRLVRKGYVVRGSYIVLSGNIARAIARHEQISMMVYASVVSLFAAGSIASVLTWNPFPSIASSALAILVLVAMLR